MKMTTDDIRLNGTEREMRALIAESGVRLVAWCHFPRGSRRR